MSEVDDIIYGPIPVKKPEEKREEKPVDWNTHYPIINGNCNCQCHSLCNCDDYGDDSDPVFMQNRSIKDRDYLQWLVWNWEHLFRHRYLKQHRVDPVDSSFEAKAQSMALTINNIEAANKIVTNWNIVRVILLAKPGQVVRPNQT